MKRICFAFFFIMLSNCIIAQVDDYELGKRYYDNNDYSNALTYFQRAADNGDWNAQYFLGTMYENGEGVSTNYVKAAEWYQKAAEQGHMYAQNQLGQMYYNGYGVNKDGNKAIELFTKSAEQGNVAAQYNLGYYYSNHTTQFEKGEFWFKKAANQGDPFAQYELGNMYYFADDYNNALIWLQKSVDQNNADAQMILGRMYLNGQGVNQDFYRAYDLFSKSANQGNSEAQVGLGYLFLNGQGINRDNMKAFEWFQKSASQGNSQAAQALGIMYYDGIGINKDYNMAYKWFTKGTDGLPVISNDSKYHLGLMYYKGQGVTQDYSMAAKWFLDAAKFGDARSQYQIAKMYHEGKGVKQDYSASLEWMTKAAEKKKYAPAHFQLGFWYFNGDGVEKDYNKSEIWLKKGIEIDPDNPYPYSYLALIYCKRNKNYKEAYRYVDMSIERFAELDNHYKVETYDIKGQIALELNKMDDAQEILNKCIELEPDFLSLESPFVKEMKKLKSNGVDSDIIVNPSNNKYTYAIIIGNEKYKNNVDVPYANNDAKIFGDYVVKTLGVPQKQVRLVENAGYNDIRMAVNWLTQAMTVCRGKGRAIVYYAGHGIPNETDLSSYLLPVDGIGSDYNSAFSLNELYDKLSSVETQSVTIFLDACFSGSKREEGMLTAARGVAIKVKQAAPKGNLIVFSAAQGDETAYPYKDKQHGMFTYYLLKKLQETKGEVTLGELGDYLTEEVGRQSFVKNGKIQTPTVKVASSLQGAWREMKLK